MAIQDNQRTEFWARAGCLLPLTGFWFALIVPALLTTVVMPMILLTDVQLSEQALEQYLVSGSPAVFLLCLWEVKRSLFLRRMPVLKGYQELVGLVSGQDLPGLQNALGFLIEARSPQEVENDRRWWNSCLSAFLFAALAGIACFKFYHFYAHFVSLVATVMLGLVLWRRFFQRLHRSQCQDHWLRVDLDPPQVTWVERQRGRPALPEEPLVNPRWVLSGWGMQGRLALFHSQNQKIDLLEARGNDVYDLIQYAETLAKVTGLELDDQRGPSGVR